MSFKFFNGDHLAGCITNCLRGYPSFVSLTCALNRVLAVIVIKNIVKRINRINEYKAEREIHE